MLQQLQEFGLSEKESHVYMAALELGPATADQIAKQAGVKRSTTYVQIESLQEVGLMSSYEEGKKTFFAPESPENLARLLENQKRDLELRQEHLLQKLPELQTMFEGAGDRPVVRFYQGKEGIKTLREEALQAKSKNLLVISSNDDLAAVFTREERDEYSKKRAEKDISMRLIYTRADGKFTEPAIGERISLAYMSPSDLDLATDIIIFDNSVGLMTLKGHLMGVMIQSREITMSLRSIFELLWQQADKD